MMELYKKVRALLAPVLMVMLVAGLVACGGGGEADTEAPSLTLDRLPVSTLERTRALSGSMEPGAQVEVSADTAALIGPVNVTADRWSCSVDLVPGVNTISVKATDSTGNNITLVFALLYDMFTLDQVLPSTSVQGQTLSGTLASGASLAGKLTRTSDGVEMQDIPAITASNWTQTLNLLADDSYTLTLTATDALAQTITRTQSVVIDTTLPGLNVTSVALPVTSGSTTIEGTAAENATISLTLPAGVVESDLPVILPPGVWSRTLTGLPAGRSQIDVTATAPDGKQATARLFVLYQPE